MKSKPEEGNKNVNSAMEFSLRSLIESDSQSSMDNESSATTSSSTLADGIINDSTQFKSKPSSAVTNEPFVIKDSLLLPFSTNAFDPKLKNIESTSINIDRQFIQSSGRSVPGFYFQNQFYRVFGD